MFVITIHQRYR